MLILGRRQIEHVVRAYVRHYNCGRPHRALDLTPPDTRHTRSSVQSGLSPPDLRVRRRDLLAGLIDEYEIAAAA
jgi:putative transposase